MPVSIQHPIGSADIPISAAVFCTAVNPFAGVAPSEQYVPAGSILNALSHSGILIQSASSKSPPFPAKPTGIKLKNCRVFVIKTIIPTLLLPDDQMSSDKVKPVYAEFPFSKHVIEGKSFS